MRPSRRMYATVDPPTLHARCMLPVTLFVFVMLVSMARNSIAELFHVCVTTIGVLAVIVPVLLDSVVKAPVDGVVPPMAHEFSPVDVKDATCVIEPAELLAMPIPRDAVPGWLP